MAFRRLQLGIVAVLVAAGAAVQAFGQSPIQFPRSSTTPAPAYTPPSLTPTSPYGAPLGGTSVPSTPPTINATPYTPPAINATPYTAPANVAPSLTSPGVAAPRVAPFDPYSSNGAAAYSFWNPPPATGATSPPVITTPGTGVTPLPGSPLVPPPTSPYGPPPVVPYGSPYGTPAPATTPPPGNVFFPNGVQSPAYDYYQQSLRLVQDIRFRHTYLYGDHGPQDLEINDSEIAVTFTLPNFLGTTQPLFISPAFALNLWDGPANSTADLPGSAYSAYLDFQYQTNPQLQIGAELGVRVGAYTDFNTFNSHSIRVQGLALGVGRLTPTITLKFGVIYIDRNDIKLLPAGGILWQPSPQVRFDFFFPQPKLAMYLSTIGAYEVWGYVAGEYGGGAWTIERASGISDRVDINDIRVSTGLEFTGPRGFTAYAEVGYVFDRELVYVVDPSDNTDLRDTVMARAGFTW